jgi:hypothetical protein
MARGGEQTHFGYESVPLDDKQGLVDFTERGKTHW